MRTVAIIQARMSSTRLPGKVLMDLGGLTVLGWCARAANAIPGIDAVAVATSQDAGDDKIAKWCDDAKITYIRGSLQDVLGRYMLAAQQTQAQVIMRLTADCPLLDPQICEEVLQLLRFTRSDYASNTMPRVWPDGTDCEAFTMSALTRAYERAKLPEEREHVTPFIRENPQLFKIRSLSCPIDGLGELRWTLDKPKDYNFLSQLVKYLPADRPPSYTEVLDVIDRNPELKNADR